MDYHCLQTATYPLLGTRGGCVCMTRLGCCLHDKTRRWRLTVARTPHSDDGAQRRRACNAKEDVGEGVMLHRRRCANQKGVWRNVEHLEMPRRASKVWQ